MPRDWRKRKKPLPRRRRSSINLIFLKMGLEKTKMNELTRLDYRIFE